MKPDAIIARANSYADTYSHWPAVAYKVDALLWNRVEGKFLTHLPSGQRLEVSLSGGDGLLERHCAVGLKLDDIFLGWFTDTVKIPSIVVRAAVEGLITKITPVAKHVVEAVKIRAKAERQAQEARARANAREHDAEQGAKRAAAIRKADNRN